MADNNFYKKWKEAQGSATYWQNEYFAIRNRNRRAKRYLIASAIFAVISATFWLI